MNERERFLACILGRPLDRPPFFLHWGPWGRTWQRWEQEGRPKALQRFEDVRAFFGADSPPQVVPVHCGPYPLIEREVLSEDDESCTYIDGWGIVRQDLKAQESMSAFLKFPVQSRSDWARFRDQYLKPHPGRLEGSWRESCGVWMDLGLPIQLGSFPNVGIFGSYRWLLGDEECLIALHDDPELVRDIMEHMTDLYLSIFEQVVREVRVDVIHLWEDMCSRNGPLLSPAHFVRFISPCYRRIRQFAGEHGIEVISVDTDGDPRLLITPMMEAGINLLFPFEVAAGCDVNEIRKHWPSLGIMGGVDKRTLAEGPAAIDAEIERIQPALQAGRYLPDTDHLIPSDVSWDNYTYYAQNMRQAIYAFTLPSTAE